MFCDYIEITLEFENWMDNWKDSFKPIKIDDKVMIVPDWDENVYNWDRFINMIAN